jgi:hypothetical protein
VGVRDLFTGRTAGLLTSSVSLPITSPYAPAPNLSPAILGDILGEDALKNLPMDRGQAITIPAVSKARNLLVSTIAKFPLRAIRRNADGTDTDVTDLFPWLYRTNGAVSPYERMAWTVDDLIFGGVSLWTLDRGAPAQGDAGGRRAITNAEWVPPASWGIKNIDGTPRVVVDGLPIADDNYLLINSPFEGLLNIAGRTLRGGVDVEGTWVGRARNPVPLVELHQTDDSLEPDDVKALVEAWAKARTNPNGGIGYTPQGIELRTHGETDPALMVEGRNAIRTDVGSFLNVRASMLDGTMGIDSLTYTTTAGERNSFYEFDLPFWTDPIAARLSLDDVVPRGVRIRFDMYEAFNAPTATGPAQED